MKNMIINEDLKVDNLTLGEIDDKLSAGTTVKKDLLFQGDILMDNTSNDKSGTLSHPWTDYDILYIMAGVGNNFLTAVETETIPLFIFKPTGKNVTYARLWSNIPSNYNAIIRIAVDTSSPTKFLCRCLQATGWTECSVFAVYGIKFIL